MMEQSSIFDYEPAYADTVDVSQYEAETIDRRFARFHTAHPEVYRELVRLTRQAVTAGRSKVGLGMVYEVIRWNTWLAAGDEAPKLNNDYRSRYARLIMATEPDLAGIYEVRAIREGAA